MMQPTSKEADYKNNSPNGACIKLLLNISNGADYLNSTDIQARCFKAVCLKIIKNSITNCYKEKMEMEKKMSEKLSKMLGDFLKRNRNYVIEVYFRNEITGNIIAKTLIFNKLLKQEKEKFIIGEHITEFDCTRIFLPYNEIMDCCETRDEYNQQIIYVILKNNIKVEFDCCGMRM
jgi:hypothetical protein